MCTDLPDLASLRLRFGTRYANTSRYHSLSLYFACVKVKAGKVLVAPCVCVTDMEFYYLFTNAQILSVLSVFFLVYAKPCFKQHLKRQSGKKADYENIIFWGVFTFHLLWNGLQEEVGCTMPDKPVTQHQPTHRGVSLFLNHQSEWIIYSTFWSNQR